MAYSNSSSMGGWLASLIVIVFLVSHSTNAQSAKDVRPDLPCPAEFGLYVMDVFGGRQHAALPISATTLTPVPFLRTKTPALATNCDDWEAVCSDVEWWHVQGCRAIGETGCFCKGVKQYNKCMTEGGCQGRPEWFMIQHGCQLLD